MPLRKPNLFEFKYEGDFTSLDALTVLHSQINFVTAIKEIKDHKYPEIELNIKIKGIDKGSLEVDHIIEVATITGIFVLEHYQYIENVFKILSDIVKIKKFLKGQKAEESRIIGNDKIEIHIKGENVQISSDAFNIYQKSPVISNALNSTSRLIRDAQDVDYIKVTDKKNRKNVLKIEKEDLDALSEENPYLIARTDEQVVENQILFIKKPNLFPEKNKKWIWELIYQGRDIKATIVDDAFKDKINKGFKVGQGDRLKADLKIYYKYDERFNTYLESQKFDVLNVKNVIERTNETRFDFQ